MPLSEFYLMNDEQIASLHEQLAENFYDDDLYKTVFMDDRTRLKTLRYLFRHYVKALKPYCHFLADSAECRSVMVVWDSTLEQPLQYHAGRTAVCKKHTACHRMLGYVYQPLDSGIRTG